MLAHFCKKDTLMLIKPLGPWKSYSTIDTKWNHFFRYNLGAQTFGILISPSSFYIFFEVCYSCIRVHIMKVVGVSFCKIG